MGNQPLQIYNHISHMDHHLLPVEAISTLRPPPLLLHSVHCRISRDMPQPLRLLLAQEAVGLLVDQVDWDMVRRGLGWEVALSHMNDING